MCHLSKNDPIQRPDESFVTLDGISKRYQMIVKNKGTIHWRMRSCWCLGCIDGLSNGTLGWGQTHVVQRCVAVGEVSSGHERGGDTNLDGNMYSFEQKKYIKTAGAGVSALVQQSTKDRNTVASELAVGDFVLFDAHDDEVEPIWLGRVMPNPEWNGQGVYANNSGKNISFREVAIGRREVAIYVMWYEKINATNDDREYWVSRTEREPLVQNNRYLIPVEVNLHQMLGGETRFQN